MPLEPYPARSARHLPLEGKALSVVILFLHVSCIRIDDARKTVFSFRCLPHWGRGTALAVDRVLSLTAYLRRSFPLVFHTASPSNLRPFGAPPSIGRRECPREPLPLEGAAERSEAGLASFFAAKLPPLCLPHAGKVVLSLCHHPQPALPLRGQAKEAQGASCASLIGMHFPAEIRYIHCLMSFRIAAEGKTALPEVFLFADIAFDRPAIEESADIEE